MKRGRAIQRVTPFSAHERGPDDSRRDGRWAGESQLLQQEHTQGFLAGITCVRPIEPAKTFVAASRTHRQEDQSALSHRELRALATTAPASQECLVARALPGLKYCGTRPRHGLRLSHEAGRRRLRHLETCRSEQLPSLPPNHTPTRASVRHLDRQDVPPPQSRPRSKLTRAGSPGCYSYLSSRSEETISRAYAAARWGNELRSRDAPREMVSPIGWGRGDPRGRRRGER